MIGISKNGFDVSEAFALFLIQSLDEFAGCKVVRVEEVSGKLSDYRALIGVGSSFNAEKSIFVCSKSEVITLNSLNILNGYNERLSMAGLVYAIYGKEFLLQQKNFPCPLFYCFRRIYEYFIEIVDCYTWCVKIKFPSNEKHSVNVFLNEFAIKLKKAIKEAQTDEDFVKVAQEQSKVIGTRFLDLIEWFREYLRLTCELEISLYKGIEGDKRIALCDFDFCDMTLGDVLSRVIKHIKKIKPQTTLPFFLIGKYKENYFVECLKKFQIQGVAFPEDWPTKGNELFTLLKIPKVSHITRDRMSAVVNSKDSAITLAKALLAHYDNKQNSVRDEAVAYHDLNSTMSNNPLLHTNQIGIFDNNYGLQLETNSNANDGKTENKTVLSNWLPIEVYDSVKDFKMEFVFNVISDPRELNRDSQTNIRKVVLQIPPKDATYTSLITKVYKKHPDLREFVFYHSDGTLLESNCVTEDSRFWRNVNLNVCLMRNSSAIAQSLTNNESAKISNDFIFSDVKNSIRNLYSKKLVQIDDYFLGVKMEKYSSSELLACALITLLLKRINKKFAITNLNCETKDANFLIKIGSCGPFSYSDHHHYFTESDFVSLASLDVLMCRNRLSCAGIVFAIYGQNSIAHILKSNFKEHNISDVQYLNVFRRVYARLIYPIDQFTLNMFSDRKDTEICKESLTREALIFVEKFAYKMDENRVTSDEIKTKFLLAIHCVQDFYKLLVVEVYRQLYGTNVGGKDEESDYE